MMGTGGQTLPAAIIAPSLAEAYALFQREWDAFFTTDRAGDLDDPASFYGVQDASYYAPGFREAFHRPSSRAGANGETGPVPPDRIIDLGSDAIASQIVLLAKGYEG